MPKKLEIVKTQRTIMAGKDNEFEPSKNDGQQWNTIHDFNAICILVFQTE